MNKSKKSATILAFVAVIGFLFSGLAQAQFIVWVAENRVDEFGVHYEQPYIDMLMEAGYDVELHVDDMTGVPLTGEQIDILEGCDLIIVGRSTSSGSYIDPESWNHYVTRPIILNSVYLSRNSRWQWFNSDDLISNGRSGAPPFKVEQPDHPIFTGVTPDADGFVHPLDPTIGCGNTSLANKSPEDVGDEGIILATVGVDTLDAVSIVYWPPDAAFFPEGIYFPAGPRLLFPCGTQEDASLGCPIQGEYNLTPDGAKMFLNAVAWLLGKDVGVEEKSVDAPSDYDLAQNYPNPFNPSTTIEFSTPSKMNVKLTVYNTLGQEIVTLADQAFQAGRHTLTWNGLDRSGAAVESGVYFYKLLANDVTLTRKMILIK